MNTFSLDCERIWGMPKGISSRYISKNIAGSDDALRKILANWAAVNCELSLVFVLASLPGFESPATLSALRRSDLGEKWAEEFESFSHANAFGEKNSNVTFGVHSVCHNLYTELNSAELELEIDTVNAFTVANPKFRRIFVFPKNLSVVRAIAEYKNNFEKVRLNSRSWLYRSNSVGVSSLKRVLRYLDSFLPIYELFCDKSPEVEIPNFVVGTHFFRANLSSILLRVHVARLRFGIKYLNWRGYAAHVWSHPHNFVGNDLAIKNFVELGRI